MQAALELGLRERRPPFWSPAFALSLATLVCIGAAALVAVRIGVHVSLSARYGLLAIELIGEQVGIALLASASLGLIARSVLRRRPLRVVRLGPGGLLAPTAWLRRLRVVPYTEIESLPLQRVWLLRRTFLSIGLRRGGSTILPDRRFGSPEQLGAFRDAILLALETLPSGSEQRARLERRTQSDERLLHVPWLSLAVALVMAGIYWATSGHDPWIDGDTWVFTGGLVAQGELFRAVTANWLHGDLFHLAWNSSAILLFGYLGERVLGWQRMLGIGMASGVLGFLGSLIVPLNSFESAAGMSAWAFGWQGAWLWLHGRHRAALPPLLQSWATTLPAYIVFLQGWGGHPTVDVAHGVGLVAGIATAALITRNCTRSSIQPIGFSAGSWIVWTSAAFLCGALIWGLVDEAVEGEQDARLVLQWMLDEANPASDDPTEVMESLNDAAWRAAREPSASRERLELAERAARWAVDLARWAVEQGRDAEEARYLDSLATVRYRLGDFDSAVELAWRAVEFESEPDLVAFHRSQAARFELARSEAKGGLRVGEAPEARLEPALDHSALRLSIDEAWPAGLTIHAVALQDGGPLAHIRVNVPAPVEPTTSIELPLTEEDLAALAGCDEIVTTRTELTDAGTPGAQVEVHALLEEVLDLP